MGIFEGRKSAGGVAEVKKEEEKEKGFNLLRLVWYLGDNKYFWVDGKLKHAWVVMVGVCNQIIKRWEAP